MFTPIKTTSAKLTQKSIALRLLHKICAVLLLFTCAFPAFVAAQSKFTGTPAKFDPHYFKRLTTKAKIATIPFTAEEFIKFAPEKVTRRGVVRPMPGGIVLKDGMPLKTDGQWMIKITKRTKYKEVESSETKQVPLDQYVAELNNYEAFLNQFGETLRDGKFNRQDPNDTLIRSNLGVLFALRNRSEIKGVDEGIKNRPVDVIYKPDNFSRYLPHDPIGILLPDQRIKTLPNLSTNPVRVGSINANARIDSKDFVLNRDGNSLRVVNGKIKEIGSGLDKSYGGQILKINSVEGPSFGCSKKSTVPDYGPLISGDSSCESGASNTLTAATNGTCPGDEPSAEDPKCFYDGEIEPKTYNFANIEYDSNGGGNGWFGGFASFKLFSNIFLLPDGSPPQKKILGLNNSGVGGVGIELLGSRIDLITAKRDVSWKTGMSAPETSGGDPVVLPQIFGENFTINSNFSQEIEGPGTLFFVGPVPISITSKFKVDIGLKREEPFINIPDTCNGSQTGSLKMFMGPNAKASVSLRAAVDAVVASAGIEGELVLAEDDFGASMETLVQPSTNRVTFKPSIGYHFKHLAGHVYLFVELDLGIYTKKWSVEVISFNGFEQGPATLLATEPLVISAKKKQ